jgi:CCR4-NOT transcription complex subunit 6
VRCVQVDGCATFWKKSKFLMTENCSFEYNHLARQEASSLGFDEFEARRFMNRLNRDNIAQVLVLESLARNNSNTRGGGGSGGGGNGSSGRSVLCVVNTHLYSNTQGPDVKLWQTMHLVRQIESIVGPRDLPLLLCGDFNSEPSSAVYEFLTHGAVSTDLHPELTAAMQDKVRVLPELHNILHDMHLSSTMDTAFANEPLFTNYTAKFKGTLDYIFYTPSRLRVLAATSMPEEQEIKAVSGEGLPSACYPSDHMLLCCDVALATGGTVLGGGGGGNSDAILASGSAKLSRRGK